MWKLIGAPSIEKTYTKEYKIVNGWNIYKYQPISLKETCVYHIFANDINYDVIPRTLKVYCDYIFSIINLRDHIWVDVPSNRNGFNTFAVLLEKGYKKYECCTTEYLSLLHKNNFDYCLYTNKFIPKFKALQNVNTCCDKKKAIKRKLFS